MAFCEACGAPLNEGARFCGECGHEVRRGTYPDADTYHQASAQQGVPQTHGSLTCDADGVWRWPYELSLWSNPTILITLYKVFLLVSVIIFVLMTVIDIIDGELELESFVSSIGFGAIGLLVMLMLATVGYAVYALIHGGKYCVVFTMNEKGVRHQQVPSQYSKAQVVGALNVIAGIATGDFSQIGIGLVSASTDSLDTTFAGVSRIRAKRARNVIYLSEGPMQNQVYVESADFDFVYDYIASRCPKARKS